MSLKASLAAVLLLALLGRPAAAETIELMGRNLRLTPHHKLHAVRFVDERHGWVAGSLGLIAGTRDGGRTWARGRTGTAENIFSLDFADPSIGWASGANGTLLATVDGGRTWVARRPASAEQLFALRFLDRERGFAVGAFGAALRTSDGGETWQPVELDWKAHLGELIERRGYMQPHLYALEFAGDHEGWMVGEFGVILHTADGGTSWRDQPSGASRALYGIHVAPDRRAWVVGQSGTLLYSENGGDRWRTIDTGVEASLFNVVVQGPNGWIVGDQGTILASADGGLTWRRPRLSEPSAIFSWHEGLALLPDGSAIVAGDRAGLFRIGQ